MPINRRGLFAALAGAAIRRHGNAAARAPRR